MKTTKNWYSMFLSVIVIGLFLAPSVTFAAWYNPFSWSIWSFFKTPAPVVVQVEPNYPEIPETSTSTATTTPAVKVIPKKPQATAPKTVVQPTQISAPAEDPAVEFTAEERAAIKSGATKIVDSRTKLIATLNDRKSTYSNTSYPDEYADLSAAIDGTIAIFESEKNISKLIVSAADVAPADSRDELINSYTQLLAIVQDTDKKVPQRFSDLAEIQVLAGDIVKARIQLDVVKDLSTQYGVTGGTQSFEQDRARVSQEADDYINSLLDAQEKIKNSQKEKVETYLKAIISLPIGNQGWLNSR